MNTLGSDAYPQLRIAEFCETGSGGTPLRSKGSLYYGGPIPWVKSGELRESTITATEETLTEIGLKESSAKLLPRDTLLVALYGATVGRLGILGIEAATNQAVCYIIPDERRANRKYLFYALQAQVPIWLDKRVGGGQPNISQGIIRDTLIPLPPLPEQQRIADILDKADAIRRKRQEAVQSTHRLIHAIFWNMFGEGILDLANGRGQADWRAVAIDDIKADRPYSCIGGPFGSDLTAADYVTTPGVPVIRGGNLSDDSPYMNEDGLVFVSAEKGDELGKCSAYRGDIVFSQRGARLAGQLGIIRDNSCYSRYIVSQSQMKLTVDTSQIDPVYLVHYCQSQWAVREMERRTISTGVPHINLGILKAFPVYLPPRWQQEVFRNTFRKQQSLYESNVSAFQQYDYLFNALVQRAFRGEL